MTSQADLVKKCEKCEAGFGLMDKKLACPVCGSVVCEPCAENQVIA